MNYNYISRFFTLCFVLSFLAVFSYAAASENNSGMNYYIDGTESYDLGEYELALKSLGKAIEIDSSNLNFQYYYAMTYNALGRYNEAISIYTAIINKDARNYLKAYFDLAGIYLKNKKYEKALETITAAEWLVPDNSRIYLEKGYIYRRMKNYKSAVENFNRAFELNPKLAQTVLYNIGIVYFVQKDYTKAKDLFNQTIKKDPGTKLAEYAGKGLVNIEAARQKDKSWKLFASLSYSYDDNISEDVLDFSGHMGKPSDKEGQYQVLFLTGEYRLLTIKELQLSTGYQFSYINFNDSDNENSMGNSPYLLMRYNLKPCYLSLKYNFAHYFADSESRQTQHIIKPSLTILEPYNMRTFLSFVYQIKNYENNAPTEDLDIWTADFVQYFNIPETNIFPRIAFKYGSEDSEAKEYSYSYIETMIGVAADLPYKIKGDIAFTDIRSDYDMEYNSNKREDKAYLIEVSLMRRINKTISTRIVYNYTHNSSNLRYSGTAPAVFAYDPFKYEKNLVRLSFDMNF